MSNPATVHVSNISPQTTEKEIRDFFSFCGHITSISVTPESGNTGSKLSATISFERDSAAKTAVLLDGTPLNSSPLSVQPSHTLDEIAGKGHINDGEPTADDFRQEDKPRTAVLAEYLSHGYVLGDDVLNRGIALDKQHGISAKFTGYLNSALQTIEQKTNATERAKTMDTQYGITNRAGTARSSLQRYFEKALDTPTGQKIRSFYSTGEKQVFDIHNEAKRLAEMRKQKRSSQDLGATADGKPFVAPEVTTCACGGSEGACNCPPGKCGCARCAKPGPGEASDASSTTAQLSHAGQDVKEAAKDTTIT